MFRVHSSWRKKLVIICAVFLVAFVGILAVDKTYVKALPCPCNMFSTPTGQTEYSDGDYELGFKFKADVNGYITGVRFYKQGSMAGTHTGNLWTTGGTKLATATFTGETSSGWQSVSFSSPVAVTAGTTYVASVSMNDSHYIATAGYFNSEVTNYPLRVPSSGSSGGNGVYNTTPGNFPTTNGNGGNYWVDVTYVGNTGSTAPTVSSTDPVADATGVKPGDTISAVFDEAMDRDTITASTFIVKDSNGDPVTGTVSYDDAAKTASFIADQGFGVGETYTATLKGGSGTVAENMEGIALAADHSWSFTVSSTNECPCSLENLANPAGAITSDDSGGLELGVKVKPSTNGYISSIRFYKNIIDTQTTHDVHIWNSSGSILASGTSSNETDYGWQTVKLSTPLQVKEGQLYIISYSNTTAQYIASVGGLSSNIANGYLTAYASGSSENAATGSGNNNGVYTTTAGNYPSTGSATSNYYWIDAVFSTMSSPPDPLDVKVTQPSSGSYGVERDKPIKATFDHALNSSTVNSSTVQVVNSDNDSVSGTVSYESSSHSVVFTPASSLAYNQKYTVRLSDSIEDTDGVTLGSEYSFSFTVGTALATDVNQGPAGRYC